MRTRIVVVNPLFSVEVEETNVDAAGQPVCKAAAPAAAGTSFWTVLAAILQKAAADLPAILPELLDLIAALQGTAESQAVGERVGANGAILNALSNLLQKAAAALPTILPEILQLIALFGGSVQTVPAPAAS